MKTTHLCAVALLTNLTVCLGAHDARTDEPQEQQTSRNARFASKAPPPVIATSACALRATLAIDEQSRRVDVRVDGRRCVTTPPPNESIAVDVHIESEKVLVEVAAPGVSGDILQEVVIALARELRSQIERATAPAPPPPIVTYMPNHPRPLAYDATWDRPTLKVRSPAMMGFGVASMVVGGLIMFGGTVSALSNTAPYQSGGLVSGLLWLGIGAGATFGLGVPLFVVGKQKVPRFTAGISPTGGSLRMAF